MERDYKFRHELGFKVFLYAGQHCVVIRPTSGVPLGHWLKSLKRFNYAFCASFLLPLRRKKRERERERVSITGPGGTCHHYNSRRYRADGGLEGDSKLSGPPLAPAGNFLYFGLTLANLTAPVNLLSVPRRGIQYKACACGERLES